MPHAKRYALLTLLFTASVLVDVALATRVIGALKSDLESSLFLAIVFSQATAIGAWSALAGGNFIHRFSVGICLLATLSALLTQVHRAIRDRMFALPSLFVVELGVLAFIMFASGRANKIRATATPGRSDPFAGRTQQRQFTLLSLFQLTAAIGLLVGVLKRAIVVNVSQIPYPGAERQEIFLLQLLAALLAIPVIAFSVFVAWTMWGVRVDRAILWIFVTGLPILLISILAPGGLALIAYTILVIGYLFLYRLCGYQLR